MITSRKRLQKTRSGQALVELVLALIIFITVAFFYIQMGLSFGVANYIQYATFMAARALQAGYATQPEQRQAAQTVLEEMVQNQNGGDRFAGITQPSPEASGDEPPGATYRLGDSVPLGRIRARNDAWKQGVSYRFAVRMYMIPAIPGAKRGPENLLNLDSESWLGREPTEKECLDQLADRKNKTSGAGALLYDNGC